MPKKGLTLFMESEEFGREDFRAESWKEAMGHMRELFEDYISSGDGIERKIGIIVPGEDPDDEAEED